jgi:multicomponent Na+:H+ antiporter subunit D
VLTQTQLLFFSALAFVWLNKQGLYPPELRSTNLDVEWLYRKVLPVSARWGLQALRQAKSSLFAAAAVPVQSIRHSFSKSAIARYHLSESWPTGSMVFWISITLATYLLLDYVWSS